MAGPGRYFHPLNARCDLLDWEIHVLSPATILNPDQLH